MTDERDDFVARSIIESVFIPWSYSVESGKNADKAARDRLVRKHIQERLLLVSPEVRRAIRAFAEVLLEEIKP